MKSTDTHVVVRAFGVDPLQPAQPISVLLCKLNERFLKSPAAGYGTTSAITPRGPCPTCQLLLVWLQSLEGLSEGWMWLQGAHLKAMLERFHDGG